MSAQTQANHGEHPTFCDRNHVPGAQHSSALEGSGWVIDVLDAVGDHPAGLEILTEATLTAFDAIALATSMITVADVLTSREAKHRVVQGTATPADTVTIPDTWTDPRRNIPGDGDRVWLDIYTPEAAYQRGAELLTLARGVWSGENYERDARPCLALRDLLPHRVYGAWVGDGLSDLAQRRIESRIRTRARRMTATGAHWPVILWGSATGDPIGAAVGQVPWSWREDWGYTPIDVPADTLAGLTGSQIDTLAETGRTMYRNAPRAVPPSWAVGEPDLEGNRLSTPLQVQHENTTGGIHQIIVRAKWLQTDPSASFVVIGGLLAAMSADGQLRLDRQEALSLAAAINQQADLIEGGGQ